MQSTASNLEFKLNVNLRLVKPDFMQSTAVNLEFKLKVIFKLLSCNRPLVLSGSTFGLKTNGNGLFKTEVASRMTVVIYEQKNRCPYSWVFWETLK